MGSEKRQHPVSLIPGAVGQSSRIEDDSATMPGRHDRDVGGVGEAGVGLDQDEVRAIACDRTQLPADEIGPLPGTHVGYDLAADPGPLPTRRRPALEWMGRVAEH